MPPLTPNKPNAAQLRALYVDQRMSATRIASQVGVSRATVSNWLQQYGIERRPIRRNFDLKAPGSSELRALYIDRRMTARQIADQYGVRHISVLRWLASHGIEVRPSRGLANRGVEAPTRDELYRLVHVEHLGYRKIAERYGVSFTAVGHWLAAHGIEKPTAWQTRRRGVKVALPGPDELRCRYAAGESTISIAADIGVSATTIGNLCREHGIELRPDGWQRGRRWECADGHLARSVYEQRVDNWLAEHGYAHEVEPRLPCDRRYAADFLVAGIYIEVWGVTASATYDARRERKTRLYREHNLPLIELPAWTFGRGTWRRRLVAGLPAVTPA
jgi:DNA invertase Pin-like site-specific DNA recombinase